MLENVLDYEQDLFLQLNSIHSPFGNQFMWLYSGKIAWIPLAILFVVILSYKNRKHWKETLLIFAAIALVITFCDQFSSGFCKPFFLRFRPTHHPDFMNEVNTVFDYRGGRYGFISSHAANAFGFATLTSLIFRYRFYTIMLYLWATINAYSRIYLGVHFITDIVPGILVGLFFGWVVYKMYVYIRKKAITGKVVSSDVQDEDIRNLRSGLNLIIYILILTIVVMAIISMLYAFKIIPAITVK
ncbi:MAG: phosphatase PAP2 family protein [Tannerella sp.]|jgi:undecaprenyl-diphosphatase|nr:phosphatase PAP2 family protein [Tannerella sp.]